MAYNAYLAICDVLMQLNNVRIDRITECEALDQHILGLSESVDATRCLKLSGRLLTFHDQRARKALISA